LTWKTGCWVWEYCCWEDCKLEDIVVGESS
jgi:hypothetical protein